MKCPAAAAVLLSAALAGCASSGYTALRVPAPKGPPLTMVQVNGWWQGATATLQSPISLGSKPLKNGLWFGLLEVPRQGHDVGTDQWQDLQMMFYLPDTPRARQAIQKNWLMAGAVFEAKGWDVERIGNQDMNVLRLQLSGDNKAASVYFGCKDWKTLVFFHANDCSVKGVLQRAEPYLRAHFFQLLPVASAPAGQPAATAQPSLKPEELMTED